MFNLLAQSNAGTWVIFGIMIVAIIGLFVWQSISGKKRQQEAQAMVNNMKIGDRIKTIGGVCGFLVEINNDDNTIVIETGTDAQKCLIRFDKAAIYQTGPANPSAPVKEEAKVEEKAEAVFEEEKPAEEVKAEEKAE